MKPSAEQMDNIYLAWQQGLPPTQVSKALRLVLSTVIREYVRLDEAHGHIFHQSQSTQEYP
jgi:hypothetical protein